MVFKYFRRVYLCTFICALVCKAHDSISDSDRGSLLQQEREAGSIQHSPENLKDIDEQYSKCNGIDIRELTIQKVQELFATNQLTSVALTNCYLQRIRQMNPTLNAVIELNPDALRQALMADLQRKKYKNGGLSTDKLMLGIPILIKDNVGTADFMETTVGSLALVGIRPKRDADVVRELKKVGAVILGKANLSEFAHWRGTNMTNGWSGRGGQTKNVYNMSGDASESSAGSASSVAANLAMVSIGTETDGSLMAPASVESLFTIKPTFGTPSIRGVVPLSHSQDHVGPMARTAIDMTIMLDGMVPKPNRKNTDSCGGSYTSCVLQNKTDEVFRVGVLRYPFWDASIANSTDLKHEIPYLEEILEIIKSEPEFDVKDPVDYSHDLVKGVSREKEYLVVAHDFKHDFNEYLKNDVVNVRPNNRITTLHDVIEFNKQNSIESIYDQDYLIWSENTDGIQNKTYLEARESTFTAAKKLLDAVLQEQKLDAVIAPTEPRHTGLTDPDLKDVPQFAYSMAAITGYPCLNVPAGIGRFGMPFGLTLVGMPHSEVTLLRIAHKMEQLAPKRQPPTFLI